MLTKEEFWSIVNKAVDLSNGDKGLQTALMVQALSSYDDISIASFRCIMDELAYEIESWDLISVEIILKDDSLMWSGDGHYYFLLWVVSLGETAYHKILDNPDAIIDFLPQFTSLNEIDPEYFMYTVPFDAFALKYKDAEDISGVNNQIDEAFFAADKEFKYNRNYVLKGEKFSNLMELRRKLPRLCEMYEKDKSLEDLFKFYFKD